MCVAVTFEFVLVQKVGPWPESPTRSVACQAPGFRLNISQIAPLSKNDDKLYYKHTEMSNIPLFPPPGSSLILQQETPHILYPTILSTQTIDCDCVNITCDSVYWFRSTSSHSKVQYIGRFNRADRSVHAKGLDEARFTFHRKSMGSFSLRIINVTEADAGIYSCVLRDKKNTEMWKSGILLRPGGLYAGISNALFPIS